MLRVAILGTGWAGTRQVEAARELSRKIEIDSLVDNDPKHLEEKASELAIEKTFTDWRKVLKDPDVDAVSICLPHPLHCETAVAAAEAGKHILCEKPIAMHVGEATSMIEAAHRNSVKLYVAESATYLSMARRLREIVRSGEHIGELIFGTLVLGFYAKELRYPGRRAWLTKPEMGGTGTWMLHGIHTVGQMRFILGEVKSVCMAEHHAKDFATPEIEGTMCGLFVLKSGVPITVVQTCESHLGHFQGGYRLFGDRGSLHASSKGYELCGSRKGAPSDPELRAYPEQTLSPYAEELEAFADTVSGETEGPTTGESERRSLAVVEAGYESARTGKVVDIENRFGIL